MNNIEEIAKQFGVPMPDTAKQLDFKGRTNLSWYRNYYGSLLVFAADHAELLNEKHGEGYLKFVCKAPQIHELSSLLPNLVTWHLPNVSYYSLADFCAQCYIDLKTKGVF
jgi:hypothetical protein